MGAMGSDTGFLRSVRGASPVVRCWAPAGHPSLRRARRASLFAGLVALGACGGKAGGAHEPDTGASERATALLAPSAPLPSRAETVALADAVAIASSKQGKTPEGGALART